jgi:hypothetical protein
MIKRILIVGLSKSGTTALFYKIKGSMPKGTTTFFEPKEDKQLFHKLNNNICCKVLLKENLFFTKSTKSFFDKIYYIFDKKIFIVRDPRDNMISRMLYSGYFDLFAKNPERKLKNMIEILKNKEKYPNKISFIDTYKLLARNTNIFEYLFNIRCYKNRDFLKMFKYFFRGYYTPIIKEEYELRCDVPIKFIKEYPNYFIFKYEDMVDNINVNYLEKFIGMKLRNTSVDKIHLRVVRSKSYGAWRNWFTEEDIKFFKPILKGYMLKYGYDFNDWKLNAKPKILSKNSSDYYKKLINERRKILGLPIVNL